MPARPVPHWTNCSTGPPATAVSGTGGCPYAKGASGNVATEDIVYLLDGMGFAHGVDLEALIATGRWLSSVLGRESMSKVNRAKQ